jgi:hypothetical protein
MIDIDFISSRAIIIEDIISGYAVDTQALAYKRREW